MNLLNVAYAATGQSVCGLVANINRVIINPIIGIIFALAVILFFYGMAKFLFYSENDDKRAEGRSHMVWGVIGMFIMVSVFGIIRLIMDTLGVGGIGSC